MFGLRKKNSFAEKIAATCNTDRIFLVRAHDKSGKEAWYYVLTDIGKEKAFKAQNGVEKMTLTDYGRILYSGFGKNPPAETAEIMLKDYGFKE